MQSVQYKYSKFWSIFYTALLLLLVIIPVAEISEVGEADEFSLWFTFIYELILLPALIYVVVKALIPVLKGKIALEINSNGIVSYMKGVTAEWGNIQDMSLIGYRAPVLNIKFKWEEGGRNAIRIPLQLVKGNDDEIFNTAWAYFEKTDNY